MQYFVIEERSWFLNLHGSMVSTYFKNMEAEFYNDSNLALEAIEQKRPSLLLINPFFADLDPLIYLSQIQKYNIPFIVILREPEPRLVIEIMRLGASDIIEKRNTNQELIKNIFIRTYLEKERWETMNKTRVRRLPSPYPEVDRAIQNHVFSEKIDTEEVFQYRNVYREGQTYQAVFIGLSFRSTDQKGHSNNDDPLNEYLENKNWTFIKKGGIIWPNSTDLFLAAFIEHDPREIMRLALELYSEASDELFRVTGHALPLVVVASGLVPYQQDLSSIYSPVINLVTHILKDHNVDSGLYTNDDVYQTLSPFQKALFEGMPEYDHTPMKALSRLSGTLHPVAS